MRHLALLGLLLAACAKKDPSATARPEPPYVLADGPAAEVIARHRATNLLELAPGGVEHKILVFAEPRSEYVLYIYRREDGQLRRRDVLYVPAATAPVVVDEGGTPEVKTVIASGRIPMRVDLSGARAELAVDGAEMKRRYPPEDGWRPIQEKP